jgi:RecB family exonuclease
MDRNTLTSPVRAHLTADSLVDVLPTLRSGEHTQSRISRGAAADLVWSLGILGGNPVRPQGALEWSPRTEERQTELEQQLETARTNEDAEDPDEARGLRNLERRISDLRAIRPALSALVEVARGVQQRGPLSELWPRLRTFLEKWLLQPGEGPRVQVILDEHLGKMAADSACGTLEGDDALRAIEEAILSTRISPGRFGDPAVYVGSIRAAVGLRFAAVRVVGLAEGYLPGVPREDPVIPDVLRESLRASTGPAKLVSTAADRALSDLHALDVVVRNTKQRIVLSAPRLDVERSQREPSSVILEAAATLGRPNSATGRQNPIIPGRTALIRDAFAPARVEAARFRREFPLGEAAWQDGVAQTSIGIPPSWQNVLSLDLERIDKLSTESPGSMDGVLGADVANLPMPGLSPDYPLSPSAIHGLLNCAHAFLLQRLLGFSEPTAAPPQREIGQPMYGNLFHATAATFYKQNGDLFGKRKGKLADWVAAAEAVSDETFQAFLKEYPLVGEAVRAQQRQRLRQDMRDLLHYDWATASKMRFVDVERTFGDPTPVAYRVGEKLLYLRGRIDRIDVDGGTGLVRDLKTGRPYPRVGRDAAPGPERDVQIAIYGMIARQLAKQWGIPERIAAAYAYFGQRGPGERSFREDFHDVLEPAAMQWLKVAVDLLAERLFPRTPNAGDCSYCCFRPVCGSEVHDQVIPLLVSGGSPLSDYAAMKGRGTEEQDD